MHKLWASCVCLYVDLYCVLFYTSAFCTCFVLLAFFMSVSIYTGFVHVTKTSCIDVPQGEACIRLSVRSGDGAEVHFKVRMNTSLEKVMHAYAARMSVRCQDLVFMYEG